MNKQKALEILEPDRFFGEELDTALDASLPRAVSLCRMLVKKLPRLNALSRSRKRLAVFFMACTLLEHRMAQGEADYEACTLAVELLRARDKSFRRAVSAFENAMWDENISSYQIQSKPGGIFARAYGRTLYPAF